jgi:hypothetical protein
MFRRKLHLPLPHSKTTYIQTKLQASIAMPLSQLELNLYCDGQILCLLGCHHPSYDSGTCGVDALACV